MKELLKRIKREIEQELLRIRNELKNIDKKTNEHDFELLKNREGFLVLDLETLKKGINDKSIETILRHLRIEDEDTKATKIDILKIGQYFLDQKLVFKTIEIYEKFVNNKKNIENFNLLGAKTLEEGVREYQKGNYKIALELYKKAWYAFGIPSALHNLGCMHFFGEGVEKNHKKGLEYWKLGAENNCQEAQFNVGIFYLGINELNFEIEPEFDFVKGIELLKKSAKQGDPKASLMLKSFDKKEVEEIIKRAKKDKNFNLLLNANLQKKVQSKNEVGDLDEIK